jgi:hypothetical protein
MLALLVGMVGAVWINVQAAPVALHSPAVVDTLGVVLQPAILHSAFIDTTTGADTVGYQIITHKQGRRWPDSVTVKLYGINPAMAWAELLPFRPDSVEGLQGYRRVWWSGSTVLEDSVIVPGQYEVSGDSLLPSN